MAKMIKTIKSTEHQVADTIAARDAAIATADAVTDIAKHAAAAADAAHFYHAAAVANGINNHKDYSAAVAADAIYIDASYAAAAADAIAARAAHAADITHAEYLSKFDKLT